MQMTIYPFGFGYQEARGKLVTGLNKCLFFSDLQTSGTPWCHPSGLRMSVLDLELKCHDDKPNLQSISPFSAPSSTTKDRSYSALKHFFLSFFFFFLIKKFFLSQRERETEDLPSNGLFSKWLQSYNY